VRSVSLIVRAPVIFAGILLAGHGPPCEKKISFCFLLRIFVRRTRFHLIESKDLPTCPHTFCREGAPPVAGSC
jgi:hypothetical protein